MTHVAFVAVALLLTGFIVPPAAAHHSFAMYDMGHEITIEGTMKEFAWTNPHVFLKVTVPAKDGKPEQIWAVESTSPGNLRRLGWTKDSFKPGDKVKLTIYPLRSGEPGGGLTAATQLDTGKEYRINVRAADKLLEAEQSKEKK